MKLRVGIHISFNIDIVKWWKPCFILFYNEEPDAAQSVKIHNQEENQLD